jgi:hypothetical protein
MAILYAKISMPVLAFVFCCSKFAKRVDIRKGHATRRSAYTGMGKTNKRVVIRKGHATRRAALLRILHNYRGFDLFCRVRKKR